MAPSAGGATEALEGSHHTLVAVPIGGHMFIKQTQKGVF